MIQENRRKMVIDLSKEQEDIENLIKEENDPQIRLQLMIMNRINLSLIANTETIHEIGDKLETHLTNYEERTKVEDEILNKGKGAWKVIAWFVGIIQIIGVGIWYDVKTNIDSFRATSEFEKVAHAVCEIKIKKLEDLMVVLHPTVTFSSKITDDKNFISVQPHNH